jgi:hypothetical protein
MAHYELPARKALLVDARRLDGYGLRDGVYLVTPDMRIYEGLYKQCVTDYVMHGRPMPYAAAESGRLTRKSGHSALRKIS